MGRTSRKEDVATVVFAVAVAVLGSLLAALYILSFFYCFVLLFPLIYYATAGAKKIQANRNEYVLLISRLVLKRSYLDILRRNFGDLQLTKTGAYDERYSGGRNANQQTSEAISAVLDTRYSLNGIFGTSKNSRFIVVAVCVYGLTLLGLYNFYPNSAYNVVCAVVISLIIATLSRMAMSISETADAVMPLELPSVSRQVFVITFFIWILGMIFTILSFKSIPSSSPPPSSEITTESVDKPNDTVEQNNSSNYQNVNIQRAKLEFTEMPSQSGFLTRPTLASTDPNNDNAMKIDLSYGSEIIVTGVSIDKEWYQFTYSGYEGLLYVPTGHVAVFSEP